MNRHDHIENELKDLQSGLPLANSSPQTPPPGYFEGLAEAMLAKIKATDEVQAELNGLSPFLANLQKDTPYTVPVGYFEENVANASVVGQEPVSDLLQSVGRAMPYQAPAQYFENLPATILAQVSKPQAKVVPLFARTWMRVAAAAVVAGALVIAGLPLLNRTSDTQPATTSTASVATAGVKPALQKEIKQTSTKDLEKFVEDVAVPVSGAAKSSDKRATDLLKDVSATEMERFLSSMPSSEEEGFSTD